LITHRPKQKTAILEKKNDEENKIENAAREKSKSNGNAGSR